MAQPMHMSVDVHIWQPQLVTNLKPVDPKPETLKPYAGIALGAKVQTLSLNLAPSRPWTQLLDRKSS